MAFVKKPVTGMRDILPAEMEVRTRLTDIIAQTYLKYGFTRIETPIVEHAANLTSRQGGDNEKLIFRILKRGDALKRALGALGGADDAQGELSEEGLRYDLTVPLARYYAANASSLPQPFKALQIGPVFRADRPQRGRFRQFTQCDIDILGDPTDLAEKELIAATTEALDNIGFGRYGFYVVINDRRLLTAMIAAAGFPADEAQDIFITLDKADKIGAEGVDEELLGSGCPEEKVRRLRTMLADHGTDPVGVRDFADRIGTDAAREAAESIADIMESVGALAGRDIRIVFDPTLVRGMGYYTGTIFEIRTAAFGSAVGGGGRYDRMVGSFTGRDVPAVGFSIGFERIITVIMESGRALTDRAEEKSAWLVEKGMSADRLSEVMNEAQAERAQGRRVLLVWMAKNKKFQKDNLRQQGYEDIREFFAGK